MIICLIFLDLL